MNEKQKNERIKIKNERIKNERIKIEKLKGDKDLELTDLKWLIDHHKTKEQERKEMVDNLNIQPGDTILDLGCGPGLWTQLLAGRVKPHGKVVGIDFSSGLIEYAIENLDEHLKDIIEFRQENFYTIPFEDNTFDIIFFGNCMAYVNDGNCAKVVKEMKRVTKNGGRVIAKDFDGAVFIVHPIDAELSLKVLSAAARSLKENPPNPSFDNFVGRKMHGLFLESDFRKVSTSSHIIQKFYPLTPEAKRYITGNAEWHVKVGSPYLEEEDIQKWRSHFDPKSDNYVLDREDFYFCMLEIVTEGTV